MYSSLCLPHQSPQYLGAELSTQATMLLIAVLLYEKHAKPKLYS